MPTRVRVVNEMRSSCRSAMSVGKKTTAFELCTQSVASLTSATVRPIWPDEIQRSTEYSTSSSALPAASAW